MNVGDRVAVYDARDDRWRAAEVVSLLEERTATVAAREWWAIVPLVPDWIRPVHVVEARAA